MALDVALTPIGAINQGETVGITATVTENGGVPFGTLVYAWTATRGSFQGATNGPTVTYHANFEDDDDVDVDITCNVTRAANANPTVSSISLATLHALGIENPLLNIYITDTSGSQSGLWQVVWDSADSTSDHDGDSDLQLAADIEITRLRWRDSINKIVLSDTGDGHLGDFFDVDTAPSVYIILANGSVYEIPNSDYDAGGSGWARFNVTDTVLQNGFNAFGNSGQLILAVGDAGSIGWAADSGTDIERLTAQTTNTAPTFPQSSYSYVDVALAVGTEIATIIATDSEADAVSYSLHGAGAANFDVSSAGVITVATALMYGESYDFTLRATDGSLTTDASISVSAIANTAPVFPEASYAFDEIGVAVSSVVGSVVATDANSDDISYSLVGTDASLFDIDSNGQITVATELSRDGSYSFSVRANDGTDTTDVAVTVATVVAGDERRLLEQSVIPESRRDLMQFTIGFEDPDNPSEVLTYKFDKASLVAFIVAGIEGLSGDNRLDAERLRNSVLDIRRQVTTELTTPTFGDRLAVSDESETDTPTKYITLENVADWVLDLRMHLADQLTSVQNSDKLAIIDDSESNDPTKYVTLGTIVSYTLDFINRITREMTAVAVNDRIPIVDRSEDDAVELVRTDRLATFFLDLYNRLTSEVTDISDNDRIPIIDDNGGNDRATKYAKFSSLKSSIVRYHEWDSPVVTNAADFTLDQFVGNVTETGDLVRFEGQCRVTHDTSGQLWTVVKPRLALPVVSSSPTRMMGGGQGYGGSEQKFLESGGSEHIDLGVIGVNSSVIDMTVLNGVLYVLLSDEDIYSLNTATRVLTKSNNIGPVGGTVRSLAGHNGILYLSTDNGLFSVSGDTLTEIGDFTFLGGESLVSFNGSFYYFETADDKWHEIDIVNGTGTAVGNEHLGVDIIAVFSATVKDGKIFFVGRTSSNTYEIYCMSDVTAVASQFGDFNIYQSSSLAWHDGDRRMYYEDSNNLEYLDLYDPPIHGVDFQGETYTSAIVEVKEESNLIQLNIEKMQQSDQPVFINFSGSYKK